VKHRADIDGLRAIAVLSVVAFHLPAPFITGGFVGVDIFFVISGFLISSAILTEIKEGKFSIVSFYERRIRRIFPALVFMLLLTTAAAFRFLLPSELKGFSQSMGATILSLSNVYFWQVSDYFAQTAEQQPLLHTWSLSVEEQFYVFFPLVLITCYKFIPRRINAILIGGALWSFALSAYYAFNNPTEAFYLPHSRAWELLIGSILATGSMPRLASRGLNEMAALSGLLMIAVAILKFSTVTIWPGVNALLPCVGAALLIQYGPGTITSRALSFPPFVFVGLTSYSLYLFHWPLFFFQKNFMILPAGLTGPVSKVLLLTMSVAMAAFSWWFVERPFRYGRYRPGPRMLFLTFAGSVAGFLLVAILIQSRDGMPGRFSPEAIRMGEFVTYDATSDYRRGVCFATSEVNDPPAYAELNIKKCLEKSLTKKNYLLMGDSYAADLWYGLSNSLKDVNLLQATGAGCKPLLETANPATTTSKRCLKLMSYLFNDFVPHEKFDAVLIGGSWDPGDLGKIERTLEWFQSRIIPIVLFGPKVTYDAPLPRILAAAIERREQNAADKHRLPVFENLDKKFSEIANRRGIKYVSYFELLCSERHCISQDDYGHPLTSDRSHLNRWGSTVIGSKLRPEQFP